MTAKEADTGSTAQGWQRRRAGARQGERRRDVHLVFTGLLPVFLRIAISNADIF